MVNRKIDIRVDCVPSAVPFTLECQEDMLFLHVEEGVNARAITESVRNFSFSKNLKVVMTSGFMSEALHDVIDDAIATSFDSGNMVLTIWSEDALTESIWEFVNVHGDRDGIKTARLAIITATPLLQDKILKELGHKED